MEYSRSLEFILTEGSVMRRGAFHLPQERRLVVGVLRDLSGGTGEVEVTTGVAAADSARRHDGPAAVVGVAHAGDGGRGGGRALAAGRAAGTLSSGALRTLLPRVEALAHGRVRQRRR